MIKGDNSWVAVLVSLISAVRTGVRGVAEDAVPALTTDCLDDAVQAVSQLGASVSPSSKWRLAFSPALQTASSCAYALL